MESRESRPEQPASPRDFWLKVVLIVGVLLFCVVVFMPSLIEQTKKVAMTKVTGNAKSFFYLMVEFDGDYGQFPNDQTAEGDAKLNGYTGQYSNDYFGQFIAGGYTSSEEIFYAKGNDVWGSKPDNVISPKEEILKEGECGFAYNKGYSTNFNSAAPLIMAPMYGDGFKFDPYIFDNKAVVLRIDGSVKQLRLNDDRHAIVSGSQTLFEAGPDTVWGEKGYDRSNLLYAKYPYEPRYKVRESSVKITVTLVLLIGLGLLLIYLVVLIFRRFNILRVAEGNEEKPTA